MQSPDELLEWALPQTAEEMDIDLGQNYLDPLLLLSAPPNNNHNNDHNNDNNNNNISPLTGLPPTAEHYILSIVSTHGCIRQSRRCARQLRDYWVPTLPPALRGINIDSVMAECVRLGKRMYQGRDDRHVADQRWLAYCSEKETKNKWLALSAAMGREVPPTTSRTPPPSIQQLISPPPPPPPRKQQSNQYQQPPQLYQQPPPQAQSKQSKQLYLVMASYPDLLREEFQVLGVFDNSLCSASTVGV